MNKMFTMELVLKLDTLRDHDVREILRRGDKYDGPSPFILDPDYDLDQLPALAAKWGVSLEILCQYRVLVDYIDHTAQMCIDPETELPPEAMAEDLGIDFAIFEPYFLAEVEKIRQALSEEDDDNAARGFSSFSPEMRSLRDSGTGETLWGIPQAN